MLKIAIIVGSTRPGSNGEAVARWVRAIASKRKDAQHELVDIAEFKLPLLDEPVPPSMNKYSKPHTRRGRSASRRSTASSSSLPSTTTAPRGRSRTRSTTSTSSGTTRRRASSLTAAPAAPARSSSCASSHLEKAVATMLDELVAWSQAMRALRTRAADLQKLAA